MCAKIHFSSQVKKDFTFSDLLNGLVVNKSAGGWVAVWRDKMCVCTENYLSRWSKRIIVIILKQAGSNSVNVFIQSQHTVYEEFNMKNWKDKLKLK